MSLSEPYNCHINLSVWRQSRLVKIFDWKKDTLRGLVWRWMRNKTFFVIQTWRCVVIKITIYHHLRREKIIYGDKRKRLLVQNGCQPGVSDSDVVCQSLPHDHLKTLTKTKWPKFILNYKEQLPQTVNIQKCQQKDWAKPSMNHICVLLCPQLRKTNQCSLNQLVRENKMIVYYVLKENITVWQHLEHVFYYVDIG